MKLVTAIIKPARLDAVKTAVLAAGVEGATVTDVRGFGRQKGKKEVYRGTVYEPDLLQKIRIEIAVEDADVEQVVEAIRAAAHSGEIGDGKIFITPLDDVLRIRTGERGTTAL
ncbi:MAG: P-II family nitrogen regulator [Pseudomonadota bacterium]